LPFRKLACLKDLPSGALIEVLDGDRPYAICNVGGEIRALYGTCPHHGGPLGQGALDGGTVTCPWHAWPFDSSTGECEFNRDLRIPTYAVRIESGDVLVDLPDKNA
jgi:nitrite reductase (NADH) small subunit